MSLIEIHDLTKTFGPVTAVDHLNLAIENEMRLLEDTEIKNWFSQCPLW
jgi:hypothetical protein